MLGVSVFEREKWELVVRYCVSLPFFWQIVLSAYLYHHHHHHHRRHHHHHLHGQWLPKFLVHILPNSFYTDPKYTPKLLRIGRTSCLPTLIIICPKRSFKHLLTPVPWEKTGSHAVSTAHGSGALCQSGWWMHADWSHTKSVNPDIVSQQGDKAKQFSGLDWITPSYQLMKPPWEASSQNSQNVGHVLKWKLTLLKKEGVGGHLKAIWIICFSASLNQPHHCSLSWVHIHKRGLLFRKCGSDKRHSSEC